MFSLTPINIIQSERQSVPILIVKTYFSNNRYLSASGIAVVMNWRTVLSSLRKRVTQSMGDCGDRSIGSPTDPTREQVGQGSSAGSLTVATTANGQFFIDEYGRTVILHGVNVGQKRQPFIPSADEFTARDVQRIRSWGFNLVRLGVIWRGIAPERGSIDSDYLDRLCDLVQLFDEHEIHVLIDMHQDLYSRDFGGDGAPSWAVYDDGIPFHRTSPWPIDYTAPAVTKAFDHLWLDDHDLHAAYSDAVRAVAMAVGDVPAVVGYELFNEPMPGTATIDEFERQYLPQFYNRVIYALREVDASTPIWVEPMPLSNLGKPSTLRNVQAKQLVFSFHNYATGFESVNPFADRFAVLRHLQQKLVMHNNQRTADRLNAVPVLTEFCPGDTYRDTAYIADLADEYMIGWAYWAYSNWGTRTSGTAGTMASHDTVVDVLVRPYPPAIAGIPLEYSFDRETRHFELTYTPSHTAHRPTVIFVPSRQYPDGYEISIDGGTVTNTAGQYVRLGHQPSVKQVIIDITPT
jgi:endoglycosylceramidase